ncbi:MAG: ornithine carbamoyltransferase [Dehalococcoidia bacterium]|nr:ornithine carbamoyltransferase [Dehalococcoidia bacterium]
MLNYEAMREELLLKGRDLLRITDVSAEEIYRILDTAMALKRQRVGTLLAGKKLAMVFQKPSLRTRVSFEVAMTELGGHAIYLSPPEVGLGERESPADVARVLSRYVDCIVARTFRQQDIDSLARYATVPVINALSDEEHPCQILADLLTIYEKKGNLAGLVLAFIGDGNNVSTSLMLGAAITGMQFRIASPAGFEIDANSVATARKLAENSGAKLLLTDDVRLAAKDADILYTDVWTSMGQEEETDRRQKAFVGYQVNRELVSLAKTDALVLHDLPAHKGEEITAETFEAFQAVIFDQAENRLHAQKAVLALILGS